MNEKKNEKMLSINFFASSSPFSNLSIRKGIKTEIETIEATVTKIKSGILNAV